MSASLRFVVGLVSVGGCAPGAEPAAAPPVDPATSRPLEFSIASRDCAPTGGPATAFYLATARIDSIQPLGTYLRITVWEPPGRLAGRTWSVAGDRRLGDAALCISEACEPVASGRISVERMTDDTTLTGVVDLVLGRGEEIRGGFTAGWRSRTIGCM
jgi:hypothetical protein